MNLLEIFGNLLGDDASIKAISENSGASKKKTADILTQGIPVLLQGMTENSSNDEGAQSLFNALSGHTEQRSVEEQIKEADIEDGGKIVSHILGDDKDKVIKQIAKETGATKAQVNSSLSSIAPALLSVLSSAVIGNNNTQNTQNSNNGPDIGSLLTLFGGNSSSSGSGSGLDFMSLLGGISQAQPQQQTQSSSGGGLTSLLGGLFGKKEEEQPVQTLTQTNNGNTSGFDGSQLLSTLMSLLK